ncbi:MAG: hypothetical protein PHH04_01535 [Thomasclavelia sp.]|nr:hypothetical protein [Thomasclavelia sp.]
MKKLLLIINTILMAGTIFINPGVKALTYPNEITINETYVDIKNKSSNITSLSLQDDNKKSDTNSSSITSSNRYVGIGMIVAGVIIIFIVGILRKKESKK